MNLHIRPIVVLLVACISATEASGGTAESGIRFDSSDVLNLARRTTPRADIGKPVAFNPLAAVDVNAVLGAKPIAEEPHPQLSFSENVFGCKDGVASCMKEQETQRMAQSQGGVKRTDQRLIVAAGATEPAVFINVTKPATETADGDSETYWYLGRMAGNGYHRVEVQFGHDAPGNFLINPKNGKIAFVHTAADVVALSADGRYLFTFNALNLPLSLRVAKLDDAGPTVVLVCHARDDDRQARAEFKGSRGEAGFEFVVQVGGIDARQDVAMRIAHGDGAWTAAASDPGRLLEAGFSCSAL